MLGLADIEAGAAVSGTRGYFLLHEGVLLNQVGMAKRVPMNCPCSRSVLAFSSGPRERVFRHPGSA